MSPVVTHPESALVLDSQDFRGIEGCWCRISTRRHPVGEKREKCWVISRCSKHMNCDLLTLIALARKGLGLGRKVECRQS